jgi:RHS repeat-associated protein
VAAAASVARSPKPDSGSYSWTTGQIQYDGAGNIWAIGRQTFSYDSLSRLSTAYVQGPDQTSYSQRSYTYDAYGNLLSKTSDGVTTTLSPDAGSNHLTGTSYAYDDAGNLTSWAPGGGSSHTYQYTYDPFGLISTLGEDGTTPFVIYSYTADDERLWWYENHTFSSASTIRDLHGNVLRRYDQIVNGHDSQGNPIFVTVVNRDWVYRDGTLLEARVGTTSPLDPASVESYSVDHLGSPRLITNFSKNKIGYHTYMPFGEEWTPANATQEGNPKKFTGHERDADFGGDNVHLDYMHARYYSPVQGRFLSPDPLVGAGAMTNPQRWNRYSYVGNNPLRYTDPTGRCVEPADCAAELVLTFMPHTIAATVAIILISRYSLHAQMLMRQRAEPVVVPSNAPGMQPTNLPRPSPPTTPSRPTTPGTQATTGVQTGAPGTQTTTGINPAEPIQSRNPAQDKILTGGDIKLLQGAGYDIHELKGGENASKYDLYKDKAGNVYVKPKGGKGPGDETGINLNELN